jgi:hypothetical protein
MPGDAEHGGLFRVKDIGGRSGSNWFLERVDQVEVRQVLPNAASGLLAEAVR